MLKNKKTQSHDCYTLLVLVLYLGLLISFKPPNGTPMIDS